MPDERVEYDEFAYFADNAAEFGIPYRFAPIVSREAVDLADGRSMSALIWGEGEPEIVLIHGGAQNAHTWDTVALALDRPLVAIDLPGHGHSGPPSSGAADVEAIAADLGEVIAALAPKAPVIVGMSLGGLGLLALSQARPELVDVLFLVDITPGVDREKADSIRRFVNGPTSFASFDELLARTMEFNPTRTESSLRRGILHNAEQLDDGSWVWRHARYRVFDGDLDEAGSRAGERDYESLWEAIESHPGELVLARGMRDQSVVDDADEARLLSLRPDARVEHFVEAGHSVQGDMPIELASLISDVTDAALSNP